jgi:hypothetical protein
MTTKPETSIKAKREQFPSIRRRLEAVQLNLRMIAASTTGLAAEDGHVTPAVHLSDLLAAISQMADGALEELHWIFEHAPDSALKVGVPTDDELYVVKPKPGGRDERAS